MKILEPKHQTGPLTDHTLKLLKVLQKNHGEWLNRKDIAKGIGKRRLTPYDIELLQRLCDEDLAEIGRRPNPTPIGYEYAYRATAKAGKSATR